MKKKISIISIIIIIVVALSVGLYYLFNNTDQQNPENNTPNQQEELIDDYNKKTEEIDKIQSLDDFRKKFPNSIPVEGEDNAYQTYDYSLVNMDGMLLYANDIITFYAESVDLTFSEGLNHEYSLDEQTLNDAINDTVNKIETIVKAENPSSISVNKCFADGTSVSAEYSDIKNILKELIPTSATVIGDKSMVSFVITLHTETRPTSIVVQNTGLYRYTMNISYEVIKE